LVKLPIYVIAIFFVIVIRLIKPLILVRLGRMTSARIGHFAGNIENYLCERDAGIRSPKQRYVDIFFAADKPICNQQLLDMWTRVLSIWPAWLMAPIHRLNRLIPGGNAHNALANSSDFDIWYLLDQTAPHLQFTSDEESRGKHMLSAMGIPPEARFVCLIVRDSAYLGKQLGNPLTHESHNYRDTDIQNYVLAATELADRGYYVVRMGAAVNAALDAQHPKIIDYATNGMRSDFMDIYLGAKCTFCISTGTGWDAVPTIFRKPVVYVNYVPIGHFLTFRHACLSIPKKHILKETQTELTMKQIASLGAWFSLSTSGYEKVGVELLDNSPEEIRDVVREMVERLEGNGVSDTDNEDDVLQKRFRELFLLLSDSSDPHAIPRSEVRGHVGAAFLRQNREWLQ
jgi:putative glycosyltransferase (TIGR04372 family)